MNPLKWFIAYKFSRAALSVLAGTGCFIIALSWLDSGAREWAHQLSLHSLAGVWLDLSELLSSALESENLGWIGAAFLLDATLLFFEGFALWRGWWWGRWLVIVASLAFVPFEIAALVQHVSALRIAALVLNLLIVGWLVRHKLSPGAGIARPPVALAP
jgi:uncharacterized membrane protein (DUF2068 family)